jgi:hypothetical protein
VDGVTEIEFADALARLEALVGQETRILVNFRGTFGGCVLEGPLSELYFVPPDRRVVEIMIDGRQGLMLNPAETTALLARHPEDEGWWLEFHLPSGVVASVEPTNVEADAARPGPSASPADGQRRCERRVRGRSRR